MLNRDVNYNIVSFKLNAIHIILYRLRVKKKSILLSIFFCYGLGQGMVYIILVEWFFGQFINVNFSSVLHHHVLVQLYLSFLALVVVLLPFSYFLLFVSLSLPIRHISLTGTNALQYVPRLYPHGWFGFLHCC